MSRRRPSPIIESDLYSRARLRSVPLVSDLSSVAAHENCKMIETYLSIFYAINLTLFSCWILPSTGKAYTRILPSL
jgi:hypothetical protein